MAGIRGTGRSEWQDRGAALLIGLVVAVLCGEVLLRLLGLAYATSPMEPHSVLHHVHPPNTTFVAYDPKGEWAAHRVRYDDRGLVVGRQNQSPVRGESAPRLALMGDSFVEAIQVPFRASLTGRLQHDELPDFEVRNYGVASYSPILYLLQWRSRVSRWQPTFLLLVLYANDVATDRQLASLAERDESGAIVAVPGPNPTLFWRLARRSNLARFLRRVQLQSNMLWREDRWMPGELNADLEEPTTSILRRLVGEVEEAGTRFVLTAVPSRARLYGDRYHQPREFAEKVKAWAATERIDYLDLVPDFRKAVDEGRRPFFERDIHWTSQGHEVVAEAVGDYLRAPGR